MSVSFDETIAPGSEGTLTIEVDTSRLVGEVSRTITLFTNDPEDPETELRVRLEVLTSVRLSPTDWLLFSNGSEKTRRPVLVARASPDEEDELRVHDLEMSVPWLTATARRATGRETVRTGLFAERGDWIIEVRQTAVPEYGRSRQTLRFKTGMRYEPEIEIPVNVRIEPAFRYPAAGLVLQEPSRGPARGQLAVRVRTDLDRLELQAEATPDNIDIEIRPTRRTEMVLTAEWRAEPGEQGSVVIWIGEEAMEIPITVRAFEQP